MLLAYNLKETKQDRAHAPRSGRPIHDVIAIAVFLVNLLVPTPFVRADSPETPDGPLPYRQQPIDYFGEETEDPIANLAEALRENEQKLPRTPQRGYLQGLLDALDISVTSQVLVFSKSSANVRLIGPKTPRAIYFNDEVYVAWVPENSVLEITAVDPQKGGIFYVLPQASDGQASPAFRREESCLLCHASTSSLRVPGQLVRSFTTDDDGRMTSGYSRITHDSPLTQRWGGYYVTGTHGKQPHLGNLVGEAANYRHRREPQFGGNITDLAPFFDVDAYPTKHSDIVALMVLDHQAHFQNLVIRLNHETRLKRDSATTRHALLRYMLFADAPLLVDPIQGTSGYAEWFQKQGLRDSQGRSLRDLDLKTRLPKYRLSFLIHSRLFDGLPESARDPLLRELWSILTAEAPPEHFQHLSQEERQAILEILRDTKPNLPDYWRD